jgi:S-adenosylmethionine decarboxylase proenzyme
LHLTADLFGCRDPAGLMREVTSLADTCERVAVEAGLTVVGRTFHAFAPAGDAGLTGVLLLAESHLAIHTWPELGAVTLDVFVCNFVEDNSHKAQRLVDTLVPLFDAARVQRQQLSRGRVP